MQVNGQNEFRLKISANEIHYSVLVDFFVSIVLKYFK